MTSQAVYHLAKRYGKALFSLASTPEERSHIADDWARLQLVIANDSSGWRTLLGPLLSLDQKERLLKALSQKLNLSDLMEKFLKLITKKGRLKALPEMMEIFQEEILKATGTIQGQLISAAQVPSQDVQKMNHLLSQKTGADVLLAPQINPDLLGGIILSWQGFMIDGSLKTELETLRQRMQKGN